jgi:hypothetical protein
MEAATAQDWYLDLLMDKVRSDRYPSGEMMDRIERTLRDRERAQEYIEILMEKVGDDQYPSGQMLNRIERVAKRIS